MVDVLLLLTAILLRATNYGNGDVGVDLMAVLAGRNAFYQAGVALPVFM